ncbi:MAG: hypothetical protein JW910_16980 [Anaerolineae bacterium]|nr:hypothetical protein [Anaerolineae bacterium]
MPITIDWYDDTQTILHYRFETPWTWGEYRAAIDAAWELAQSVDHPTDTITDMRHSRVVPDRLFQNIRQSMVEIPDTTQTVVLVGTNRFVEALLGIMRRLYPQQMGKFFSTETVEEAHALITRRRAEAVQSGD